MNDGNKKRSIFSYILPYLLIGLTVGMFVWLMVRNLWNQTDTWAESQLDTVPSSPADVPTKPIDDISGVEAVQVPTAGAEQASAIESKIDPEHK